MNVKALLYDKDGTILDFDATFTTATHKVLEQLADGDAEKFEAAATSVGYDTYRKVILSDSVIIAGSGHDIAESLSAPLKVSDLDAFTGHLDELYGAACLETVTLLPNAANSLKSLAVAGYVLGVATNDSEANAVAQMQAAKVDALFARMLGADSGFGAKPGPGMVRAFVEHSGFMPNEVAMIGDSLHDLEAGRAAGCVTIGVETGPASRDELLPHADIVLPSIAHLEDALAE